MPKRPLRSLSPPPQASAIYDSWLGEIEERLSDPGTDRYSLCRQTLYEIFYPGFGDYSEIISDPSTPLATKSALLALDPNNITLEPEYYAEVETEKFARVKPLIWLWQSFDRSPLGGTNVDVGIRLRRILAKHIFKRCGKNFKSFQFVEFSFGYNLEIGDNVVVHRHVLLDDRGGITLGNNVSLADYANVYSHTHDLADQSDVTNHVTVLEDGVRITYHATVLSGVRVGTNAMVGAGAVATKDVPPYHINLGIPAKPVRLKPNAPENIKLNEKS
ncbi:MAG: acyltransferase [Gemmatimonadota bacterium]|nr:acyltransferase [Gemmatimonadota bacterium]MDH5804509.1 acyltransferase [Gemmatimonadota bacterium]